MRKFSGFERLIFLGTALWLGLGAAAGWAVTVQEMEDWYDPTLPLFASDLITDPARANVYVADQITGRIFRLPIGASAASPLPTAGFTPGREDVLGLLARKSDWDKLLDGEIRLEWESDRLACFDGRKVFGSDRWFRIDVTQDKLISGAGRDATASERVRDQAMLAEAVAELAGRGRRVRPWRWSVRNEMFQMIDQSGRAYLFAVETELFKRKHLRLIAELDSLYSRFTDLVRADLQADHSQSLRIRVGLNRWHASLAEDPYTGERVLSILADTSAAPMTKLPLTLKKSRPALPQNWADFFQRITLLADGPAGQLIHARMRFTNSGVKSFLILAQNGRIRMIPWEGEDPQPENVVAAPEGFIVPEAPAWRLLGWTPDFDGILAIGNSRFQRIVPILSHDVPGETAATTGLFVLDADESTLTLWPVLEWPRMAGPQELHMGAEPVDLTVSKSGDAFVMAKDPDRGLRVFKLTVTPEPILDLPEQVLPEFLPADLPTLVSKTESKQTLWTISGQPPSLIRKDKFDIDWLVGQQIAWRHESHGAVLFTTDPSGDSDTALTIMIESSRVRHAVRLGSQIWILETDSGITRLDATDPTVPEITILDEQGRGLRASPLGPIYTSSSGAGSRVWLIPPDGEKRPLGLFKESWTAIGAEPNRIFLKDRRTAKFYVVDARSPTGDGRRGQMAGGLNFDYADPSSVLLCAMGAEAHCMIVRPAAPTFLLGPMPFGGYRLDASAGLFDLAGPAVFSVTQPEINLPDMRLAKTLDFIYRRAVHFEETKNIELAKFNYELYLSLYPAGRSKNLARSALLRLYASDDRWNEMIEFYKKSPPETVWTPESLDLLLDHLPRLSDKIEIARKLLTMAEPDARSAELLFFLYKHSLDPAYKSAVSAAGIPRVYRKFFDSFDRSRS